MKSVKADNETIAKAVAPFVGAWIEIIYMKILRERKLSLRSSERGLKLYQFGKDKQTGQVAPFVGAWIEIQDWEDWYMETEVAPFVGAWIEIIVGCDGVIY